MTADIYKYATGDMKPGKGGRDNKREKRLERNRESARKCRKKRKQFVGDLQTAVETLTEENTMLQLENERLLDLVAQMQNGDVDATTRVMHPQEPARKRSRSELGVTSANDFSESAVHATANTFFTTANSQQLEEISPLAIVTTYLLYSVTLMRLASSLAPTVMTTMQSASQAAAPVPAASPLPGPTVRCSRSPLLMA